jgi:hypothetical protein
MVDSGTSEAGTGGLTCNDAAAPAPDHSCDLAIVLDTSGSMGTVRSGSGQTRCEDAVHYARAAINFFRCGREADASGTCAATTDDRPGALYIDSDDASYDFDVVYDDRKNACTSASAKRVNVFAFDARSGIRSVTKGSVGDGDGWVLLANDCDAVKLLNALEVLLGSCGGHTPLADALCELATARPRVEKTHGDGRLLLLTDGGENASVGRCAGADDSTAVPPYDPGSWQDRVFGWLSPPVSSWSIDTTLFEPPGGQDGADPETGGSISSQKTQRFFTGLANATGGALTVVTDDQRLSKFVTK